MLEERCSETSADIGVMDSALVPNSQPHFFLLNPNLKGQSEQSPIPVYHKEIVDESNTVDLLSVHILW